MSARLRLWWRALSRRQRFEDDLEAELAFHLEARTADLVAGGMAEGPARRQARVELGMTGLHRDDCRRARGLAFTDALARDLRYAVRGLWRHPAYSLTALAVLSIALAANALLFPLFSAYALRAPPVADPARWVSLEARGEQGQRLAWWSQAEAQALIEQPPDGIERVYSLRELRLTVDAEVLRRASGEAVSEHYFEILGIAPAQGRTLAAAADVPRPVVLGHLGWQRLLAGQPDPVGRELLIAGQAFTVVGVMPPQFTGTTPLVALYWLRDEDARALLPDGDAEALALELSGMRRDGASPEAASAALGARASAFNVARDPDLRIAGASVEPRRGYLPAPDLRDALVATVPVLLAFVLLLLIAAANLMNLVLARFASRRPELAVRVSVGAPRRRLVAQLITECVLLATLAAALAVSIAALALGPAQAQLVALMADFEFDLIPLRIDAGVALYAWALALLATLAFGVVPAWLATGPWRRGRARPDLTAMQRNGGGRLRGRLMVAQLAASVVLLVLAGLVAANARLVERTQLGFDAGRTIAVHPWQATAPLLDALAALPGVEATALASRAPLMGSPHRLDARIGARSEPLLVRAVDAGYLDVFGIKVLLGRGLQRRDEAGARVAVVSRRTAENLWPERSPLGQVIELPPQDNLGRLRSGRFEVVGVVEDVVSAWFAHGTDASAVYLPAGIGDPAIGSIILRTRDSTAATLDAITRACARAAAEQNCELMPMRMAVRIQRLPFLAAAVAAGSLGWIALAICCIGLYGLVSYAVVQRRREIGVRIALGANSARIVRSLLAGSLRQIGLGLAIGLPLAWALGRLIAAYAPTLRSFDLGAFIVVPAALAALAVFAAWLPARRCARIDPLEAMRPD